MRITGAHAYRARIEAMRRKTGESFEAERKAATGKRIERPSDDPAGFQRATLLRAMQTDLEAGSRKMDRVSSELATVEDAFSGMGQVLNQVREITVQMASEIQTSGARANAAIEIAQLRDAMIEYGNSRHGDKRLFGGQQTGSTAFDPAGVYLGDSTPQTIGVADGTSVAVTYAGDALLLGASGGPDILTMLADIASALGANDVTAVQDSLGDIDLSIDHILDQRVQIGAKHRLISNLQSHFEMVAFSLLSDRTSVEDIDPIEAFSDILRTRQAYESVVQVSISARTQSIFSLL
jgi:flagellar hook-associated protein 3 FlgL